MTDTHKKEQKEKTSSWKTWVSIAVIIVIALVLYTQFKPSSAPSTTSGERTIVATVNNDNVYNDELDTAYAQLPPELKAQYTKGMILNATIMEKLLVADAKKQGISIADTEVNEALDEAILQFGITKEQFFKELEARGITQEQAINKIKANLYIAKLYNQTVLNTVHVSEDDARAFYDKNKDQFVLDQDLYRVSHILVENESEANELLAELKASKDLPTDFAKLAMEHSIDQGSAVLGGDLNFAGKGIFVPEFEKAAFALQVGQLSSVVKTEFGYHIIYVTDKKNAGMVSFEEIKEGLVTQLRQEQEQQKVAEYVNALQNSANIKIMFSE